VGGARIEVWEADAEGFYDVQHARGATYGRAHPHPHTDADGRYSLWGVRPTSYPIPHDGPVGELLAAAGRGTMRPAHVHFRVSAPGCVTLVTHVFAAGDPHLTHDAVFGVKDSLVVEIEEQPPGPAPAGRQLAEPWCRFLFDVVLSPVPAR
jgi:hydroxyquinol 1,2-dioxygenase